jgi:hypothetical protein
VESRIVHASSEEVAKLERLLCDPSNGKSLLLDGAKFYSGLHEYLGECGFEIELSEKSVTPKLLPLSEIRLSDIRCAKSLALPALYHRSGNGQWQDRDGSSYHTALA